MQAGPPPLFSEGFADDLLNFIKCSANALNIYKQIILTFGNTTNLKLNLQKTKTLIIGNNKADAILIANRCGFQICEKLTHLGILIDDELRDLNKNWDFKIQKIVKLKNMLLALRPNLTMKIALCKTFLYSQTTYLAATIMPTESQLNLLKNTFLDFLYPKKPLFSKERTFSSYLKAGLSLPPINEFMSSLALNFAIRCRHSSQPWAIEVKKHFLDNSSQNALLSLQYRGHNSHVFAKLIDSFNKAFFKHHTNIWSAPLFNSPIVKNTGNNRFFPCPRDLVGTPLAKMLVSDFYNFKEKRLLTPYEIGIKTNIFMSQITYFRISGVMFHNLPPKSCRPDKKPLIKTLNFFFSKKQSAKNIRRVFFPENNSIENSQHVMLLNSYVNGNFILNKQLNYLNTWSLSFLPPDLKEFALFHLNNKIILNDRRWKFQNVTSNCTFCDKFPSTTAIHHESFLHFYFECQHTKPIADKYFNDIFNDPINIKIAATRGAQNPKPMNLVINLEVLLFCYFLYDCKMKKKIPSFNSFLMSSFEIKKTMFYISPSYYKAYISCCSTSGKDINIYNKTWLA